MYRMTARIVWFICITVACTFRPICALVTWHRLAIPRALSVRQRVVFKFQSAHTHSSCIRCNAKETIATEIKSKPNVNQFLFEEVGLPFKTVDNLVCRYPGLSALSVQKNMRPTVNVFTEFGFEKEDIARIIVSVPMILGHNAGWALPEKLTALQRMYACATPELVQLAIQAPFILTTSIDKNTRIADFFRHTAQLTSEQVLKLMRVYPAVATAKVDVLRRCWALLTRLYGFDESQARRIILDCPMVLSERMVNNIKDRLVFLSSAFDVQSFPCEYIKAIAMKFPSFLYLDYDNKIGPNLAILRELVQLDATGTTDITMHKRCTMRTKPKGWDSEFFLLDDWVVNYARAHNSTDNGIYEDTPSLEQSMQTSELGKMLLRLPNLVKYMPSDLRKICSNALLFLTGERLFVNTTIDSSRVTPKDICASSDNSMRVVAQYNELMVGHLNGQVEHNNNDSISLIITDNVDSTGQDIDNTCVNTLLGEGDSTDGTSGDIIDDWIHSSASHVNLQGRCVHDLIYDIVHNYPTSHSINTTNNTHNNASINTSPTITAPSFTSHTTFLHPAHNSVAIQHYTKEAAHLTLSLPRACTAIRNHPGILAYRTPRSQGVIAALTVSLGLSRAEVSKMVSTYYRLLALSVDGKLRDVLRVLAEAAVRCLSYTTHNATTIHARASTLTFASPVSTATTSTLDPTQANNLTEQQVTFSQHKSPSQVHSSDIDLYRSHPVRSMVREMVMRYPHILGSSIEKITERFAWAARESAPWDAYLACWRMSDQKYYNSARRIPKIRGRKKL